MQIKNVVKLPPFKTYGQIGVISARDTARRLRLTDATLLKAAHAGFIWAKKADRIGNRVSWGFDPIYIAQVDKLLPKERLSGITLFTDDIIEKLKALNATWEKKT